MDIFTEVGPEPPVNDAPIWICFLCTKQFSNQDVLMEHQEVCEKEAEIEEARQRILEIQRQQKMLMRVSAQVKINYL
jgi:hypothetical protein